MKKPTKPQPMNYGPYVIKPPAGGGPFPMWHARGPSLHVGCSSEQAARMHAIASNACYQQGVKAGGRDDLLSACKGLRAVIHDFLTHNEQTDCAVYIEAADAAIAKAEGGAQ